MFGSGLGRDEDEREETQTVEGFRGSGVLGRRGSTERRKKEDESKDKKKNREKQNTDKKRKT